MSPQRVVIIHGFMADPEKHWFQWLSDELTTSGVAVTIPELPDPFNPDPGRWAATVTAAIGTPHNNFVIVAHSLGCITLLKALDARDDDWTLGGLVLVSGFDEALEALPQLDIFTRVIPDYSNLNARVRTRSVISSDNDQIVPPALTASLAKRLDASLTVIPGGGHFLGSEGFTTLPTVAELARQALRC